MKTNINLNISKLQKLKITPNQYFLLVLLNSDKGREELLDFVDEVGSFGASELDDLKERGFIELVDENENYIIDNIIIIKDIMSESLDWFDDWHNLFPKGIRNSAAMFLRSDKTGSKKKLKKFVQENPDISEDIILAATKNYLNKQRESGYAYCKVASNFIYKDGVSTLLTECENYNKDEITEKVNFQTDI